MTDLTQPAHFNAVFGPPARTSEASAVRKTGLWQRFFDAIFQSRQREAEREVARFFVRSGRVLTDDIERRMMQRLMRPGGWGSRC